MFSAALEHQAHGALPLDHLPAVVVPRHREAGADLVAQVEVAAVVAGSNIIPVTQIKKMGEISTTPSSPCPV